MAHRAQEPELSRDYIRSLLLDKREELEKFKQHSTRKQKVGERNLSKAWDHREHYTVEDWTEWMRRLSVELLRESPSPSLRPCHVLGQVHQPLARELFNAAFIAVWPELHPTSQDSMVHSIEAAFNSVVEFYV